MPEFLLTVRGFEMRFQAPEGIVNPRNGVSFGLKKEMRYDAAGQSG